MGKLLDKVAGRRAWLLKEWTSGKYSCFERLLELHMKRYKGSRRTAYRDWASIKDAALAARPYDEEGNKY